MNESHAAPSKSRGEALVGDEDVHLRREGSSMKRPTIETPAMHGLDVAQSHDFSGGRLFS